MSVSNLEASETNVLEDLTKGNKKRMREHNPEEWSRHWNKIVDLSFRQGMTVQEVQTEMENHGFKASKHQYYPTLSKLGISKYVPRDVKIAICLKEQMERANGKGRGRWTYRGISIAPEKVEKWGKQFKEDFDQGQIARATNDATRKARHGGSVTFTDLKRSNAGDAADLDEHAVVDQYGHHEDVHGIATSEDLYLSWNDRDMTLKPHHNEIVDMLEDDLIANGSTLVSCYADSLEGFGGVQTRFYSSSDEDDEDPELNKMPWRDGGDMSYEFGLRSEDPGFIEGLEI